MKYFSLISIFIIFGCNKTTSPCNSNQETDSLKSVILELQIDKGRYEYMLDRVLEKDSVLYKEITSNIE